MRRRINIVFHVRPRDPQRVVRRGKTQRLYLLGAIGRDGKRRAHKNDNKKLGKKKKKKAMERNVEAKIGGEQEEITQ